MQFKVRMDACTGIHLLRRRAGGLAAHKTGAGGCGTEVRAVLTLMEALAATDLSLTSHSSMAVSYAVPKASGEAGLAQAPCHRPSQITWPLPRAKGWCQASRHR